MLSSPRYAVLGCHDLAAAARFLPVLGFTERRRGTLDPDAAEALYGLPGRGSPLPPGRRRDRRPAPGRRARAGAIAASALRGGRAFTATSPDGVHLELWTA